VVPLPPFLSTLTGAEGASASLRHVSDAFSHALFASPIQVFWYAVLPPIILQQASGLKKAAFFQNLFPILVYGVLGTLLTFALLTVSAFYLSRLPWVVTAGCSEGLLDFRKGKEGARREEEEEGTACFQDFSLIKSLLLAAILSASDGVAALKHIQPHHPPPTLHPHQPEAGQTSTADHQDEGLAAAPFPPHSSPSPAPSPPSSSSSRLGALILGENVLNEVGPSLPPSLSPSLPLSLPPSYLLHECNAPMKPKGSARACLKPLQPVASLELPLPRLSRLP